MYQNIWNVILLNFEYFQKKQYYSVYLEDLLLHFIVLISNEDYNILLEKLSNDGFIFSTIPNNDKTLITISREQIIKIANNNSKSK